MGLISANIADNLLKIDYAVLIKLLPAHECHGALVGIIARTGCWAHRGC